MPRHFQALTNQLYKLGPRTVLLFGLAFVAGSGSDATAPFKPQARPHKKHSRSQLTIQGSAGKELPIVLQSLLRQVVLELELRQCLRQLPSPSWRQNYWNSHDDRRTVRKKLLQVGVVWLVFEAKRLAVGNLCDSQPKFAH